MEKFPSAGYGGWYRELYKSSGNNNAKILLTYSKQTGVCGVQHRCLVSKRQGRGQLDVSGVQVFQLVFTLATGKQIFFSFFFFSLISFSGGGGRDSGR